ncbi:endonuclease/exonuclease/phosphatase family protein [Catellatospora sp. NPDC049609]|uniref:endonuclease/exonuclease/phosphatase family protein n=1 Tax=Catellatospora sp. NPDC049609 TaxID=3155505 RepID=UPI00341842FE
MTSAPAVSGKSAEDGSAAEDGSSAVVGPASLRPAGAVGVAGSPSSWQLRALVALLFAVTVQLLRACGPLLDQVAGPVGIVNAALIALAVFAVPGLLLTVLGRAGLPRALPMIVLALVGLWGAGGLLGRSLPLTAAGAVVGMVALALAVRQLGDPVSAAVALLAGGALDLAFRSITVTWDPFWGGEWSVLLGGVIVLAVAYLALRRPSAVAPVRQGRVWALGGYLALWTTTLGNPAFAASQSGVALQLCLVVLIGTLTVAIEVVRRLTLAGGTHAIPEPDHWIAGSAALAGLVGGLALAWWGSGPAVLLGLVLAQLSAAVAVARALAAPGSRGDLAYGLVWVLPVLLFQVHYDMPLPFDNRWLPIVLAVAVGLAGMGRRPDHPGGWRVELRGLAARPAPVAGVVALALAVPVLMHLTQPDDGTANTSAASVTVLSWNVKYGRDDATGQADPRQLARAIQQANPDVVVLQEVSRGWAIGGGVDVAEYLSRELRMPYWWAPAADGQFGNLLLTRLPVSAVSTGLLPYGQGPMHRSYLKATVSLHFGEKSLDVVTAHLTHRKPNTPTRLAQIDTMLARVDPARPTVVAGDFNFWPSWPETRSFTDGGWVSAQDVTGHGAAWTSPTDRPTNRVDWVFGSRSVAFTDFQVLDQVTASDHFPVLATLALR